jgi:hypothetical protein
MRRDHALARLRHFGRSRQDMGGETRRSLSSRSSLAIHASEGWLAVRDDFRNWFIRAA